MTENAKTSIVHGWFSRKAAAKTGTFRYAAADGRTVTVTEVTGSPSKPNVGWDDLKYVGEVTDFLGADHSVNGSHSHEYQMLPIGHIQGHKGH